jgi:hypothetical protein
VIEWSEGGRVEMDDAEIGSTSQGQRKSQRGPLVDLFNAHDPGEADDAERPILNDLAAVGVHLETVYDLVNGGVTGDEAIPVLVHHLQLSYPSDVLEGVARALATRRAATHWRVIRDVFARTDVERSYGAKMGLGGALDVTAGARPMESLQDLIDLVRDTRHGISRALLLSAVAKSGRPEARDVLEDFAEDPALGSEARKVLRRRKNWGD